MDTEKSCSCYLLLLISLRALCLKPLDKWTVEIAQLIMGVGQRQQCSYSFFISFKYGLFYCLNMNLLKSCTKAVVSNLTKWCFHPSDLNKAVSCRYCEAVDLSWPFVFAWPALTSCHLWSDDDYKLPIVELLSLAFH